MFIEIGVRICFTRIENSILKDIRLDKTSKNGLNDDLIKVNIILEIE